MITTDQSQRLDWYVRKKTDASITITCTLGGNPFNISAYTFVAEIFPYGSPTAILSPTIVNGGANGILTISLTDTQLNISADDYFWIVRTTAPTDNLWFNGQFTVNAQLWDDATTSSAALTISLGTQNVNLAIALGDGTGVTGPASSVANNFASFLNTSGRIIKDSGYNAASFLKQGSNVLTQDLNFDGAYNVGFGQSTPIGEFKVLSTGLTQIYNNTHLFIGSSNDVSGLDVVPSLVTLGAGTGGQGILVQAAQDLVLYPFSGDFRITPGGTSRLSITNAGVMKFLPAVAPVVGQVITATNVDGTWTWQNASGGGWALTGTSTLTGAATIVGSATNTIKYKFDNLVTTLTNGAGLWLANTTAATALVPVQVSPGIVFETNDWRVPGASSVNVKAMQYVTGAGTTGTIDWRLAYSRNSGAYATLLSVTGDANGNPGRLDFKGNIISLMNPAFTFLYNIQGAAIAATRTITLPLLTGDDVMVTEAFTQTLTNKTLSSNTVATTQPAGTNNTTLATTAYVDALTLAVPITTDNGGTGISNNVASTLTISGAFATTFTVTAATSVTLPISGTLISTAPGTSGNILTSNGTIWTSAAASWWNVAGATPITNNTSQTGAFTNTFSLNEVLITQNNLAASHLPALKVTPGTHTAIATTTENINQDFAAVTQTWASGTTATQRFTYFRSPTINSTSGTATFTNAYTVFIDRPLAGTTAAFTNGPYALGLGGTLKTAAGTTSYPQMVLTRGSFTTVKIDDAIETDGSSLTYSSGGNRYYVSMINGGFTAGRIPFGSNASTVNDSPSLTWGLSGSNVLFAYSVYTGASIVGQASMRIPHGVAPTSPTDGDFWTTTAGAFIRINGVTKSINLT